MPLKPTLDDYRKFLKSQLEGAEAQIKDHPDWLKRGHVEADHLPLWKGAKYAFDEALRMLESMFFHEP